MRTVAEQKQINRVVNLLILALVAVIVSMGFAVHNYSECRRAGFSRLYCASTHLVK